MTVGTKAETKVPGTGDIDIKVSVDGEPFNVRLMNMLHVLGIGYQLLFVSQISNKGFNIKSNDGRCHISFDSRVFAYGALRKSLYYLDLYSTSSDIACVASMKLWHERLAHVIPNGITRMFDHGVVKEVNIYGPPQSPQVWDGCIYGKGQQAPIPKTSTFRCVAVPDLVHSDVLGPVSIPSLGGSRNFITFIDDYSKCTTVYTMRNKSESLECFKKFHMYAKTHTGNELHRLLLHQCNSISGSEKI